MVSCVRTCGELFCTHTSTCWPNLIIKTVWWLIQYTNLSMNLLSIITTFSWPSLYILDFYGLSCLFISTCWAYVYMSDILWINVHIPLVTYSIYYLLLLTYSLHMELIDGLFSTQTPYFDLFSISSKLFLCKLNFPFYGYVDVPLVTYSVHVPHFCDLFGI